MMNNKTIETIWESIIYSESTSFVYKRLSLEGKPSLNIGLNNLNNRCLILELPTQSKFKLPNSVKQNLSLEYYKQSNCLCIVLLDNMFNDLFNDLVLSIYNRVYDISDSEVYTKEFIHSFNKWSAFFANNNFELLNQFQVKGLFGELHFLKNNLLKKECKINDELIAWKGPYDERHDFVTSFKDYEIKTTEEDSNSINISSEFQLESEKGKELELVVLFLKSDNLIGFTIKNLIDEIKLIVLENFGDNSILLNAIHQKGLTFNNLHLYDNYKFTPIKEIIYDCVSENFPKLISTEIPTEINSVKYKIQINLIDKFILKTTNY
jgi:Putative  PD-(D/E)XK family member, (DUF4420)